VTSSPTSAAITGADAVADALMAGGVDTVFGLPGVHNLALWPACARAGIRVVGSRHEQGSAYAADGYSRATGRIGVALTTTGPGAANTLGAVGEAWASHSPVVVVASDIATTLRRPGTYRGVLHECTDQAALFAPVTKARLVVGRADELGGAVEDALALARRTPRGPVYLGVPTDLLAAATAATPARDGTAVDGSEEHDVNTGEIEAVLRLLERSERPLLWIGGGTRDAGAEVDALARALGAPVIATFQARGVLPGRHPLLVGAPPHEPQVTALVEEADFVLVVGSDLDHMNTMGWELPLPDARTAINIDRADAGKNYTMEAVAEGEAGPVLRGLISRLAPRVPRVPWVADVAAITRRLRDELRADPATEPAIEFLERTRTALPDDAVVFADMCIPGYWLSGHLPVECPRGLHYPMGWGTLGFAFAASIGAAVAVGPHRPVVSVVGDGGMLFALGELATVAQEQLALTVVVVDDGGYGMLRYGREDDPDNGCDLSPVDFVAVAEGFGIAADRVDGLGDDYGQALAKAVGSGEPRLIHAHARLVPPRTTSPRWPLAARRSRKDGR
jgi:thiamine pyrophosphate-dependent acetolactate synthase large subunit-like protein